jgi:hypothetical protein
MLLLLLSVFFLLIRWLLQKEKPSGTIVFETNFPKRESTIHGVVSPSYQPLKPFSSKRCFNQRTYDTSVWEGVDCEWAISLLFSTLFGCFLVVVFDCRFIFNFFLVLFDCCLFCFRIVCLTCKLKRLIQSFGSDHLFTSVVNNLYVYPLRLHNMKPKAPIHVFVSLKEDDQESNSGILIFYLFVATF